MKAIDEPYQTHLLTLLGKGDERAFNELYKAYSRPIYLRVLYLVKDRDLADEILQELFIKLWINREALDTSKSFKAYIYTIAQNLVYNHFRKVASDQSLIQALLTKGVDYALTGEEIYENKQAAQLLEKAIEQLTPQRKEVFRLCKLEGKSYEQTSQILGISVATVNSHMTKSLQSIKEYLLKNQDTALMLVSVYLFSGL